MTIDRTM